MTTQESGPSLDEPLMEPVAAEKGSSKRSIWERYFLLRDEIERAQRGYFKTTDPGHSQYVSAAQCLEAVATLGDNAWVELEGIAILRAALPFALAAWRSRQGLSMEGGFAEHWPAFVESAQSKAFIENLSKRELELLEEFSKAADIRYLTALEKKDLAVLGRSLYDLTTKLVDALAREAVSLKQWKLRRAYRVATPPLVLLLALLGVGWWTLRPTNYALDKTVQLSSSFLPGTYPAQALVNGDTKTLGIHTMTEESPWAKIDLGKVRDIKKIVVYNRPDIPSNSVPLQLETSTDGTTFVPFALNTSEFVEWTAKAAPKRARYVRLSVNRKTSLQLCEVEVY